MLTLASLLRSRGKPVASFLYMVVAAVFAVCAGMARADIYKSVDAAGRVTYSNIPSKGAKRMDLENLPTIPGRKNGSASTPADFPRVDANTQKSRDDIRRKILNEELAAEGKLLIESQTVYKNGNPDLLPGELPKSAKYEERVGKLKQSVNLHEKNILALKQELSALK
jgi:hypothetical protein